MLDPEARIEVPGPLLLQAGPTHTPPPPAALRWAAPPADRFQAQYAGKKLPGRRHVEKVRRAGGLHPLCDCQDRLQLRVLVRSATPQGQPPAAGSFPLCRPPGQPPAADSCPLRHTARTAFSCGFLSALPHCQDSLQQRVLVRSAAPPGQPPAAGSCPLCRTARTAFSCGF